MVDAAKDWLAPYWQNLWVHGSPSTTNNPAQVWIWNPGTNPSVVVARFYDINGAILTVDEQSVPPFSCRLFKRRRPNRAGAT